MKIGRYTVTISALAAVVIDDERGACYGAYSGPDCAERAIARAEELRDQDEAVAG